MLEKVEIGETLSRNWHSIKQKSPAEARLFNVYEQ